MADNKIKAKVTPQNKVLVTNYQVNASTIKLGDMFNVDASGEEDGAVLLYNGTRAQWEATTQMDNINTVINGGNF
jgi:hypothetical protein